MFHLYFGAFDIFMYLGGIYFAMVFANAICDQWEQDSVVQEEATTDAATVTPVQSLASLPTVPVAKKKEEVSVRVSLN